MMGKRKDMPPVLALTMGDPSGVGPEIIASAWPAFFSDSLPASCPVVYGHPEVIERAASLSRSRLEIVEIAPNEPILPGSYRKSFGPNRVPCRRVCSDDALKSKIGQVDPLGGDASFVTLNAAIDDALNRKVAGIVTAPLNKESMNRAGHHFPGHTEILAHRCGVKDFAMMLYLGADENLVSPDGLAVVHVTLHTSMQNVFRQITGSSVRAKCHLIHDFMKIIKSGKEPTIGVCALNCHNGEGGLFGDEEIKRIAPAVRLLQKEGMNVAGPFPSDTLFLAAKNGQFDGIVAMIHDQGHIAVKLLGMHKAVNITLGLPIIRTSVAHGTAFDKAGAGTARTTSLIEAVRVAVLLAQAKRQNAKRSKN